MSFTVYQVDGIKVIQWFNNIDLLLISMLNNPQAVYHRNMK